MANGKQQISFDEIIQEGRKKRQAEKLAQEIFGKGRRSSAPPVGPKAGLGGSLASRVGVSKRTPSIPRSTTPRQPRPNQLSRPPTTDNVRARPPYTQPVSDPVSEAKSNGYRGDEVADVGGGLNIKGAASGPYVVVAQNFELGTTAADIESVMINVGGQLSSCKLVATNPTVIAEMSFVEKSGAEKVIETFNNKKADGRLLYVYWKSGGGGLSRGYNQSSGPPAPPEPQATAPGAVETEDVAMVVDDNAESREAENRRREERRGPDRDERLQRDVFPTGPRDYRRDMDYYDRRPARQEPHYEDGRFGFGGRGYRDGGRGRYGRDDRSYRGGQSYRP